MADELNARIQVAFQGAVDGAQASLRPLMRSSFKCSFECTDDAVPPRELSECLSRCNERCVGLPVTAVCTSLCSVGFAPLRPPRSTCVRPTCQNPPYDRAAAAVTRAAHYARPHSSLRASAQLTARSRSTDRCRPGALAHSRPRAGT